MKRIITWGESLTLKQTTDICLRAGAIAFLTGMGIGLLLIHNGVI